MSFIIAALIQIRSINAKYDDLEDQLKSNYVTNTEYLSDFVESSTKVNRLELLDMIDEIQDLIKLRDKVSV